MNEVEKKLKENEISNLIQEIVNSAQDLYKNSDVSSEDKNNMEKFIFKIRATPVDQEEELEQAIGETYGFMFLLSTKAMYQNVHKLNNLDNGQIPENIRKNITEMEARLSNVIKSLEEGDEELYSENIDKIANVAEELEIIKGQIQKSKVV